MSGGDGNSEADGLVLAPSDFSKLAAFINRTSGIKMPPSKRSMVEGRLRRRLRTRGFDDFASYCRYLFVEGGIQDEAAYIIDAVTTNKTEFFRENEHFNYLYTTALPSLAEGRRPGVPFALKFWSAACSCGAEPYTIAMVAEEFRRTAPDCRYSVLATDLCTDVLKQGVEGIYTEEMIGPVPQELRRRYLLRSRDRDQRRVRIAPEIRANVRFARLNLMDESYAVEHGFHVIFCRNVLIYFDKPTQKAVLGRLCAHLAPGGYLFLGHSETVAGMALPIAQAAPTVFRKE